jgi:hypothetical protein
MNKNSKHQTQTISKTHTIYLLNCENYILLKAKSDVKSFNFHYSIPPHFGNQIPFFIQIYQDTSKKIKKFVILDGEQSPNLKINFQIFNIKKDETLILHFGYLVFVEGNTYKDIPKYIDQKEINNIPENTKKWLESTQSIQKDHFLIKLKAKQLTFFSKNLISKLKKIIIYTPLHRIVLQQLRYTLEKEPNLRSLFLPTRYWTGLSDAVSYSIFGGHCGGQANYAAALLRSIGIPTKILIVSEFGLILYHKEKTWLDSLHYMLDCYCPTYGWIKCTPGKFAYNHKNFIITRIIFPGDENIAGNGLSYYGGLAPWFWIDNPSITLGFPEDKIRIYKKPHGNVEGVPAHRQWTENKITLNEEEYQEIKKVLIKFWQKYKSKHSNKKSTTLLTEYIKTSSNHKELYKLFDKSTLQDFINELKKRI